MLVQRHAAPSARCARSRRRSAIRRRESRRSHPRRGAGRVCRAARAAAEAMARIGEILLELLHRALGCRIGRRSGTLALWRYSMPVTWPSRGADAEHGERRSHLRGVGRRDFMAALLCDVRSVSPVSSVAAARSRAAGMNQIASMAPIISQNIGSAFLAIQVICFFVIPCSTNRLNPTGGVICAISTTSTMKMPNQRRSIPTASTDGQDHAHRQHDHRDAVEEAAEDDVEQHQRDDERERREVQAADPFREMPRQADVAHRERQERRRRRGSAQSCSRASSRPSGCRRRFVG